MNNTTPTTTAILQALKSPSTTAAMHYVRRVYAGQPAPTMEELHATCRQYASNLPPAHVAAVLRMAESEITHTRVLWEA